MTRLGDGGRSCPEPGLMMRELQERDSPHNTNRLSIDPGSALSAPVLIPTKKTTPVSPFRCSLTCFMAAISQISVNRIYTKNTVTFFHFLYLSVIAYLLIISVDRLSFGKYRNRHSYRVEKGRLLGTRDPRRHPPARSAEDGYCANRRLGPCALRPANVDARHVDARPALVEQTGMRRCAPMTEGDFGIGEAVATPLVYLVDDDKDFREEMVFGLSRLGINIVGFDGAAPLYRAYAARPSDIVILDIGLDGEDGLSIAAQLRVSRSVGIVLATARGSVDDRINGFKRGADAYLVKPIDVRELAVTIEALNRRLNGRSIPSAPAPQWTLVEGGWVITDGIGHRLRLTTSEKRILELLIRERGKTVERRALVEAIGADVYDFSYGHLDTIVSRLRRKARQSNMLLPLHAIRGLGFTFAD